MTTASRKRRGRDSERIVADHLRDRGYPNAQPVSSGAPGADLTGTEPLAIEVKARRGLDLPAWLRQAARNADGRIPVLVIRGNGQGSATVGEWAAVLPLDLFLDVTRPEHHRTTSHHN